MQMKSLHASENLEIFGLETSENNEIALVNAGVKAGFPSPAGDFIFDTIDLNRELIKDPDTTFLARVSGSSMQDMRIYDGDLILIDRSIAPSNGKIAVCYIDGEFTLKRLEIIKEAGEIKKILLCPENADFSPIEVSPENDFLIWGILTYAITKY
ncbi:translesion error-prone DNA polymerase V autoproteolytic subunit [Paenimyroides tangerinum]|uniref:Translesion error-prone DNA polymerase V autoproteolytic subunit n=2 Tax=Paenimyroides tangerinum TaxID=2488728 RepID=A0A3P3WCV7_9FLAO|nr:translesion error-prone DNA polymerase V autoproteolytic subunit [Paenimyroides tangerinum]